MALVTPVKQVKARKLDCDTGMTAYKRAKLSLEARERDMSVGSGLLLQNVRRTLMPDTSELWRQTQQQSVSVLDEGEIGEEEPNLASELITELEDLLRDSAPDSTLSTDKSHWKTWKLACARIGISPWRINRTMTVQVRRSEQQKVAYATWMVHRHMKPRKKSDPAAKPASAYQVFLGAKRVHRRAGYQMIDGEMVVDAMKAMNKRFIAKHGYRSLVTKRGEPLTRSMIVKFLSEEYMPQGTKLASLRVNRIGRGWTSWRCMQAAAAQTGFRRDEVACKTKKKGLTKVQYTRESLCFRINGELIADPTTEQLNSFVEQSGFGVILKPRPSKADPRGAFWCDKPIFLPYRENDPVCPAREFVKQELLFPVHGLQRLQMPLFADDNGKPFSKAQVQSIFKEMLKRVVPANKVAEFSFHSYRIYLACALDAVGCPHSKIKRILRWISDEALNTYVRGGEDMYSTWLDKAPMANINTVQVSNLPCILDFVHCHEEEDEDSDWEDEDEIMV